MQPRNRLRNRGLARGWWALGAAACLALTLPALHAARSASLPATRVSDVATVPAKAERRSDQRTLLVPAEQKQLGRVYFVLPSDDAQVRITSDAPLERINGQSKGVVGYAVVGPPSIDADQPRALLAGQFHLAVDSIETGISLRDEHLREPGWLDAAKHPDIVFHFERLDEARVVQLGDPAGRANPAHDPVTVRGTLVGVLTMKGVSKRIEIDDAQFTYLPESPATRRVSPGDLLAIRCRYAVKLADFGIKQAIVGSTVAESIVLDQVLYLSTVEPALAEPAAADDPNESADQAPAG